MKTITNAIGLLLIFWSILFYSMLFYSTYKFGHLPQYGLDADWNTKNKYYFNLGNVIISILFVILAPIWSIGTLNLYFKNINLSNKEKFIIFGSIISIITFLFSHIFFRSYIGWVND